MKRTFRASLVIKIPSEKGLLETNTIEFDVPVITKNAFIVKNIRIFEDIANNGNFIEIKNINILRKVNNEEN